MRLCSVEDCGKKHDARGYCSGHYKKWQKDNGLFVLSTANINTPCSIEKCKNKYKAKGFCNTHYKNFIKHGHPLAGRIYYESCSIKECDREAVSKGLCHKHYYRFKNGLDLTEKTNAEMTPEERIKTNIDIDNDSNCWNWMGAKACHGYGAITYNNKCQRVHRLSYVTFVGAIPDNLSVLHKCDNKLCCNPEHLFLGTQKDNMQDMYKKGRAHFQKKGEEN